MNKITKDTLIPISLVISIISATLAISSVWFDTRANAKEIEVAKVERDKIRDDFNDYQKKTIDSLARIETKLGIKSSQ